MSHLVVHVHVRVTPGSEDAFERATRENARQSLEEPGVLRFDLCRDSEERHRFLLVEAYRDEAAAAAHKETAHYLAWRVAVAGMMAEPRTSRRYQRLFPEGW